MNKPNPPPIEPIVEDPIIRIYTFVLAGFIGVIVMFTIIYNSVKIRKKNRGGR